MTARVHAATVIMQAFVWHWDACYTRFYTCGWWSINGYWP